MPFYVHPFVQDTNDHDIAVVHDVVEYDVVSGSDSLKAVCYLIIGAIGSDHSENVYSHIDVRSSTALLEYRTLGIAF